MSSDRSAMPAEIKRAVLVEAGHRCAIPTCRHTTVELAHIVPWSEVKNHEFSNLIALCPNCHTAFDNGRIDRIAMRQYKANLGLLHSRYSDTERRILVYFALNPDDNVILLPGGMDILVMYLLTDGYLRLGQSFTTRADVSVFAYDVTVLQQYSLTEAGREFVTNWAEAAPLP